MPHPNNARLTAHAEERRIYFRYSRSDVREALRDGDIIETYEDTGRGPSYLLLHWTRGRPIHVVGADKDEITIVVTVYDPRTEPEMWTDNYRERR